MNLNQKIEPIRGDGIPGYNRKINELISAVNWLMGMRVTNGKPVGESDQGPVFDLSQVNATQAGGPGLTDPDGNSAGWLKALIFDPDYVNNHQFDESWIWSGTVESNPLIPWMTDPDGVQAQWVQHNVCVGTQVVAKWFWGTP
jgi:hypothetical protein